MKLSKLIRDLEADAGQREQLSKHGSPITSMAEDHTEGEIAKNTRGIVAKLKKVTSLK